MDGFSAFVGLLITIAGGGVLYALISAIKGSERRDAPDFNDVPRFMPPGGRDGGPLL